MLDNKELKFLEWISQRLINLYGLSKNDYIINTFDKIISKNKKQFNVDISKKDLDMILSKYYADFFLEDCDDLKIGYSDKDRESLRVQTINIVNDIVNNNIPKEPLIKG
jgi:hypothetical protein